MTDIDNSQDVIDIRDIIERYEELEKELDGMPVTEHLEAERAEFKELGDILEKLKGKGGDEQWRGEWYPVTLIRDSYFEDYMDQMLEDCGDLLPYAKRPCYIQITIDYEALQSDYSSFEYDAVTYWYRQGE